jgi:hypothetical protein
VTPAAVARAQRVEQELLRDGLEDLGAVSFGGTLVAGDPSGLLAAPGAGEWHGVAVKPGRWRLFGRPTGDGEALVEVVLVHEEAVGTFWDLYDDAAPVAALLLPTARVLVVDGARRTDADLLRSAAEPDDLPWILDDGLVIGGLAQHPAQVWVPKTPVVSLVAVALEAAPSHQASTQPYASADRPDED